MEIESSTSIHAAPPRLPHGEPFLPGFPLDVDPEPAASFVPPAHFNSWNTLMNAHRCILAKFGSIYAMGNEHWLMLQDDSASSLVSVIFFRQRSWNRRRQALRLQGLLSPPRHDPRASGGAVTKIRTLKTREETWRQTVDARLARASASQSLLYR